MPEAMNLLGEKIDFKKVTDSVPAYEDILDLTPLEDLLPRPCGYHLLVAMPKMEEETAGGVLLPEELLRREQTASICVMVVAVGKDAYADKGKFPNGPWCAQGDWVIIRSYAGTRMKIKGQEFRLINDDTVDAVVPDPRAIKRATT